MDVSEIVSYKPDQGQKRSLPDRNGYENPPKFLKKDLKKPQLAEDNLTDRDQILKYVENQEDDSDTQSFDESALKKMLLTFEKRIYKNQELRIKYADTPEKFLESELNLHSILQEMHIISTEPGLYHVLVNLGIINSLISLLSHENSDISVAVVDLLQEMTDIDPPEDTIENEKILESIDVFIDALMNSQIINFLVQNMERLDETVKEESEGVHNSLAIIENLTEMRPLICKEGSSQEPLLTWLLKRLKIKLPFDANKLYTSEVLAIFLQNNEANRNSIGQLGGIDILLQQLAVYKKHDPATNEEYEFTCNLFDCLSSCLMETDNREKFLKGEGLQLMNLMLREKKQSRCGALKILNHALMQTTVLPINSTAVSNPTGATATGDQNADQVAEKAQDGSDENDVAVRSCNKFVEILGLRTLFPLFTKTPNLAPKEKGGLSKSETEEHVISIMASLAKGCKGQAKQRFLAKFLENDLAKVDRIIELHFAYLERATKCDNEIEAEKERMRLEGEIIDDATEEELYLKRLENGLFTLQMIDYVLLEVCATGDASIKTRALQLISIRRGSVKVIRNIMREYAGNLGDAAKDEATREVYQQRILYLIDKF